MAPSAAPSILVFSDGRYSEVANERAEDNGKCCGYGGQVFVPVRPRTQAFQSMYRYDVDRLILGADRFSDT